MANDSLVSSLRAAAAKTISTPVESLVRNSDWGKINFDAASNDLKRTFWVCSLLNELPVELIPDDQVNPIMQAVNECESVVSRIHSFSIDGVGNQNPTAVRDSLVTQAHTSADRLTTATANWVPFLAYQRGDVQRNIDQLSGAVKEARQVLDDAKESTEKKKTEVDDIIRAAREASASVGVAHFTADFSNEARVIEGQAKTWLRWTAGLALATLVLAIVLAFVPIPENAPNGRLLQIFSSKFIVLGLLLTATVWCGRLYKASKHQAAVNSHRANSLKTFQAFVKAASDDQTRDVVLQETARSIFAFAQTGYLDGADNGSDGTLKVMEVVKSAAKLGEAK